jgi:DNA mismatch repair ATPase MutL
MFETHNLPNAAKLIDSLRYLGYNNYSAVTDIVDNAIDADAKNIYITVSFANEGRVVIADDGTGMDQHTLDEALKRYRFATR